jgi:hypothetical protein
MKWTMERPALTAHRVVTQPSAGCVALTEATVVPKTRDSLPEFKYNRQRCSSGQIFKIVFKVS